jgi:hypothetical protein
MLLETLVASTCTSENPLSQTSPLNPNSVPRRNENRPFTNCIAFSTVIPSSMVNKRCKWSGIITKSCRLKERSATRERNTSMSSLAFLSDCKRRRLMLVFVVVKNVRAGLRMFADDDFLPGRAIAGAKAHSFFDVCSARLKSCPVTKLASAMAVGAFGFNSHLRRSRIQCAT